MRRDGVRIHYRLAGDDVVALQAWLRQVCRAHQDAVEPAWTAYLGPDGAEVGREDLCGVHRGRR